MPVAVRTGREAGRRDSGAAQEDFFPDSVRSEQEALNFLKKLTAVTVSTVLYHRGMFPSRDYSVRYQGCQQLYILNREAETPAAKRIVDLVRATFAAIERKQLSTIVIGILDSPSEPDHLLESYTIKLQYYDPQHKP